MEIGIVIIIIAVIFVLLVQLTACCRGIKEAYNVQLTNNRIARRRQAYFISQAKSSAQVAAASDGGIVRVATIATNGKHKDVSYEICKIQPPSRNPRLPFMHQPYHGSSAGEPRQHHNGSSPDHLGGPPYPSAAHLMQIPRNALKESFPVVNFYSQSFLEPPPSYDDCLKLNSCEKNKETKPAAFV